MYFIRNVIPIMEMKISLEKFQVYHMVNILCLIAYNANPDHPCILAIFRGVWYNHSSTGVAGSI